jgi:peptide/nickel transport system substrate-binding protein
MNVIDDKTFDVSFQEDTVIPSFFEAMSFKILPEHMLSDVNPQNINTSDPILNRNPVGTGPFRLQRVETQSITLRRNLAYREEISIEILKFDLFPNEISAVNAIKSGQIHGLAGLSIDNLRDLSDNYATEVLTSDVIYNQYWAMYFNLDNELFAEKKLRQAISSAINKERIVETLLGYAEASDSSIPKSSFAYADVNRYTYDSVKTAELLEEIGWVLPPGKLYREKDGKQLEFELLYVDNDDREKIATVIKQDLAEVGINVKVVPESLAKVRDEYIIPKQFGSLLFGVQTFLDPDRYELFHSSQISHPGLNISSYRSSREVLAVVPDPEKQGRVVTKKIPEIDDILDDARKITNKETRKAKYTLFQEIIAEDVPVIFLYHPKETYIINKRVKNVDISKINNLEERFDTIETWRISIN